MVWSGSDPFAPPPEDRDPVRRLRGRLVAPVTVWTAGAAGITVSSVAVAEGDPAQIIGLVGPLTDFWEAASTSGRFVVHVLATDQVRLADQFAGRYPGDPFEGVAVTASDYGPVIVAAPTRAYCNLVGDSVEAGYFLMVRGRIARLELGHPEAPLAAYRGAYVAVAERRTR